MDLFQKRLSVFAILLILSLTQIFAYTLDIENYYSSRSWKRPKRAATKFIILHTTEAGDQSSTNSVHRYGSANYLVLRTGKVLRIIQKHKIAHHAGRSMWNGTTSLSSQSIGIEVAGYHNKPITEAQVKTLKELLRQLMDIYDISEERVLTHSMVAYGTPHQYHAYEHRGRKRCAMQFATKEVRQSLGLGNIFTVDPDIASGRLVQADPELHKILYGNASYLDTECPCEIKKGVTPWTIAREKFDDEETLYTFPNGTTIPGNKIHDWSAIPTGTVVSVGEAYQPEDMFEGFRTFPKDGKTAWELAGAEYGSMTTIYFLPNGTILRGDEMSVEMLNNIPLQTKVLLGYMYGGHISATRSAYAIAKKSWNYPSTIYRLPDGEVVYGDMLTENEIPTGTLVLFRR